LWLNVLPGNIRAKLLYQSVGFRYEGTWHDSFETENGFCDLELLTVLATDDFEPKSFTVGGDDFSAERSLSQHQFSQLLELMQKEWPNDTRTVEDMINAVLGSEFVIALNHIESGDLIGFCRVISDRGFRAWISGVVVRKDFRGRGLGRKLIDVVLTAPELSGIHSVSLTCAPAMIPFYTKWGFEIHEDELVMNLPLRR
jgi:GNAT superfamily N-acetyltransferase